MPATEVQVATLPKCDVHLDRDAHYDFATQPASLIGGRWMYGCDQCFREYGLGLGLGRGQRLVLAAAERKDKKTPRRRYIKVRTADYLKYDDMVRYIGYRDVPVTPEPIKVKWAGSPCTVHRFEEGEYTYLRQPTQVNAYWNQMGIDRYASFGVKAEMVLR